MEDDRQFFYDLLASTVDLSKSLYQQTADWFDDKSNGLKVP